VSDPAGERVLVVPRAVLHRAGVFQGFSPEVGHYLPRLLDPARLLYLPRAVAETDPAFKQLIPYVVLRWRDQVFHYTRGSAGAEARLRALRSLGVGGHICAEDGGSSPDAYRAGMLREVAEEVFLDSAYRERAVGLINDDRTPVGQVHLGIVHVFELAEPRVRRREEALVASGFAALAELRHRRAEFETWSQFLRGPRGCRRA
jgi:predicted NUDIX family phosphoesterase